MFFSLPCLWAASFPRGVGRREADGPLAVPFGERPGQLDLVLVHFTITDHGLDNPEGVRRPVPQEYVGHGVTQREIEAGSAHGRPLALGHSVSVGVVNEQNLIPR